MKNEMLSLSDTAARIAAGDIMSIAGSEEMLAQLPKGNWIGGTTVYFVTDTGGTMVRDQLFCTTFEKAVSATPRYLATGDLAQLASGYVAGGVTMIMIPAFSAAHEAFALHGQEYEGLFDQPLAGWVTGVHLDDIGKVTPKIFDGRTGQSHSDGAVLLHVALPSGAAVELDILNIFQQGDAQGATIRFAQNGFAAHTAIVDGTEVNFAAYMAQNNIDTSLPMVANYAGALVNVSVRSVDAAAGAVNFYAPVVAGVDYRFAPPLASYADAFAARTSGAGAGQYSCNCILNYLYGDMEGKKTGNFTGPVTFGEIAYILLNQTLVRMDIQAQAKAAA
jgi:hypothetical protein